MKTRILGIAGSLRNARWGKGNQVLIDELYNCQNEEEMKQYLAVQAELHLQNFVDAGRANGITFDEIYKNLQKLRGNAGLSNSEVALAAALWSASHAGAQIEHVSLSEYFPAAGVTRKSAQLKHLLKQADGILLSTPVYFGDRGSLAQELVDLLRNDRELLAELQGKVYAGIAVGAKRNGGQETTLIYQLWDMVNAGLLGVGNDSDTTAQYGGTGHAGDVGTMVKDSYGLATSMGVGRRIAHVASLLKRGRARTLYGKVRIMFWLLQDRQNQGLNFVEELKAQFQESVEFTVLMATESAISRCIACDICPTRIDEDIQYRCVIQAGQRDSMGDLHSHFLDQDAVIPVVYSTSDRQGLTSNYQRFIERTRYLRRGDYVLSDLLTAPLLLEDLGTDEGMAIRMVTSLLRQHTVIAEPMHAYLQDGQFLNRTQVVDRFARFVTQARTLAAGRLSTFLDDQTRETSKYNPVGYILSTEKDREDEQLQARRRLLEDRNIRLTFDARSRLQPQEEADTSALQVSTAKG